MFADNVYAMKNFNFSFRYVLSQALMVANASMGGISVETCLDLDYDDFQFIFEKFDKKLKEK